MKHSKQRKYQLPDFLSETLTQTGYERWLRGRAAAHVKRDKKRGKTTATNEAYKIAIHRAVIQSLGQDQYTGERLNWSLVGRYSNAESTAKGRHYKATLALLPSVDHVGDGLDEADFRICAWRTNDAKNDLTHKEFVALCRRVVEMAKPPRSKTPIMTSDEERFMAFEGLVQWTQASSHNRQEYQQLETDNSQIKCGMIWRCDTRPYLLFILCKFARNNDPLRGDFASNSDPS